VRFYNEIYLKEVKMKITNYKNLQSNANPHGIESHKIYDTENALVMHLTLQAGQSLKPHITPVDVFFYVLEGSPTILIGEEKMTVTKDDLIESPKDIVHCIYNETDSIVRVMVSKVPKPVMQTKMV
jgi:quercetin dioxygenase-like cupin family protein